jgi:proline iminopeptidase
MRVRVNDAALFVEVLGRKLAEKDGETTERPTIVCLHGGPAWDHRTLLTDLAPLAEHAQLVFYDHRGLGRSSRTPSETWTLRQWAADLADLIRALGLERPIVLGQSFGGMVAQRFAIDHPGLASGLILLSTSARFDLEQAVASFTRRGGERLGAIARGSLSGDPAAREVFAREGLPHYTVKRGGITALGPLEPAVLDHFFAGEAHRYDHRAGLAAVDIPTLVIGGSEDPVMSPRLTRELADAFPPGRAQCAVLERCGHGPARDRAEETFALILRFLVQVAAPLG